MGTVLLFEPVSLYACVAPWMSIVVTVPARSMYASMPVSSLLLFGSGTSLPLQF